MSARIPKETGVIPMLCVPTLKDPISASVFEAMKEMARTAQVDLIYCYILTRQKHILGSKLCTLSISTPLFLKEN